MLINTKIKAGMTTPIRIGRLYDIKILAERSWDILYKNPPKTAKTILDPGEESLNEPKIKDPKNISIANTENG